MKGDLDLTKKSVETAIHYSGDKASFLTSEETRRLVASVVGSESSGGDHNIQSGTMLGRYQMSSILLVTLGYMDREKWGSGGKNNTKKFIDNPDNWNYGLNKEKFLASPEIQDQAFSKEIEYNYKQGIHYGLINEGNSSIEIMGVLKAIHLVGASEIHKKGGA